MNNKSVSIVICSFIILSTFCYYLGKEKNLFDTFTAFFKAMLFLCPFLIVSFIFSSKKGNSGLKRKGKLNISLSFLLGIPLAFFINTNRTTKRNNN